MPLDSGCKLGPYEIESPIGAGGMGEVYRARDTRLDRSVAVKVLPASLSSDPQFRERFDREARAISQLAHPNICTLYDVGEHEGTPFLVMELLAGETLEARLASGPLPTEPALAIAVNVLTALDAAHRAGIVHRDLKPGNIFLVRGANPSAQPIAKLLDFGLAKSRVAAVAAGGLSTAPTTPPASMTTAGAILGTLQYMAPEQIDGVEADSRTDLFAFGCVLFELLTGRKAFEGKTRAGLLGAILKDVPPPVSQFATGIPPGLDRLVQTCLAKEPDDRWQTARDVLRELKWLSDQPSAGLGTPASRSPVAPGWPLAAIVAAAVSAAAVAIAATWALLRPAPVHRPIVRFLAQPPGSVPLYVDGVATDMALAPDGSAIAFTAGVEAQLNVRPLAQPEPTPLDGIAGVRGPFFSPDGKWIAYFQVGDLKKVAVTGGAPVTICAGCAAGNRGGNWGDDDTIVFAAAGGSEGLRRVRAFGGDPVVITQIDSTKGETAHMWPELLPGGQAILFTVIAGGLDNATVVAQDLRSGARSVVARGSQPHVIDRNRVAYAMAGSLFAIGFDSEKLSAIGGPVRVAERVVMKPVGSADFSVARDGTLALVLGEGPTGAARIAWVDRQGQEEPIPAPPRAYIYPRLSPDGSQVALDTRDQQYDIWIWHFAKQILTRLTTDPTIDQMPVWSPDGKRIAFGSSRAGVQNVFWQAVDGTGTVERLTETTRIQWPWAFARDGKSLIVRDTTPSTGADLALLSLDGQRSIKPLIHSTFNEANADLSPDGRWLAYESTESGRSNIHVRPFPDVDSGYWQVSSEGGGRPVWSRDGRELFFIDMKVRLMSVPIRPGTTFQFGNPSVVLELGNRSAVAAPGRYYDVSPDGTRFLVIRNAISTDSKSGAPRLNVILNWGDEVKRLVPIGR